jgi:hydroxymethylpyrimidine/phosphomethylpyrimidine kinase
VRLDCGETPRLNQVTLACSDYVESVAFYRALGLRLIVESTPDYARFESVGGATLSIHRIEDGEAGSTTVYLESENLDSDVDRLARIGLKFEHGPIQQPWLWREARLRDPFGNMICLYKAGESRRYPPWRVG